MHKELFFRKNGFLLLIIFLVFLNLAAYSFSALSTQKTTPEKEVFFQAPNTQVPQQIAFLQDFVSCSTGWQKTDIPNFYHCASKKKYEFCKDLSPNGKKCNSFGGVKSGEKWVEFDLGNNKFRQMIFTSKQVFREGTEFVPFKEKHKISVREGNFKMNWGEGKGKDVELQISFGIDNEVYTIAGLKTLDASIEVQNFAKTSRGGTKFWYEIQNVPQNIRDKLEFIKLTFAPQKGFQRAQIKKREDADKIKAELPEGLKADFSDLKENGFDVSFENDYTVIIKPEEDGWGKTITLDPWFQSGDPSEDVYLYDAGFFGTELSKRVYMKFDISSIPAGATINDVNLQLYISATSDDDDYTFYHLDQNQGWSESDSRANIWAMSTGTFQSVTNCYNATGDQNCSIKTVFQASFDAGDTNFSFRMEDPDRNSDTPDSKNNSATLKTGDSSRTPVQQMAFDSSEGTTPPILFVDYTSAVPLAPTSVVIDANSTHALNSGGGTIDLSWTDDANNEDGYKIYRKEPGGAFVLLSSLDINSTSHSDLSIGDNNTLFYKVSSYNDGGDANAPVDINITLDRSAPTSSTLTLTGTTTYIDLNWTIVDDNANSGLDQNLLLYYRFDEEGGTTVYNSAADTLENTLAGNASFATGKMGNAVLFDGDGDSISAGTTGVLDGNDNVTISAWVKRNGDGAYSYETIVQEGAALAGYGLTANCNDNNVQMAVSLSSTPYVAETPNSIIKDGKWHLLTGVYDGDNDLIYIYVDGVEKAQTTAAVDLSDPGAGARFGGQTTKNVCNGSATDSYFNGLIDDIRMWTRALSAADVNTLYLQGARRYDIYRSTDNSNFSLVASGYDLNTYHDSGTTDTNGPNTPGAPTVTAINSSTLDVNWSTVTDNNTTYYYKINAVDYEGNDSNSSTQNTSTIVTGVAKFFVDCESGGDCASGLDAIDDYNSNSPTGLRISGLAASTEYCFTVLATDGADNNSSASTQACGTTSSANTAPDVNVTKIDGYADDDGLPYFGYERDGNLTIDFNVMDSEDDRLTIDINYSTSGSQGGGTVIYNDLNLTTSAPANCDDVNFSNTTECSVDFNISGISDNNYFILIEASDSSLTDFNASDNSFAVDNTAPTGGTISVTSFSGATGYTNHTTPPLTISATDANAMGFSCDNSTFSSYVAYATSYSSFNVKTGEGCTNEDGNKTVYVRFQDTAGNTSSSASTSSFVIDTSSPSLGDPQPSSDTNASDTTPDLNVSFSDTYNWYCTARPFVNGATESDENVTMSGGRCLYSRSSALSEADTILVQFTMTDLAGNKSSDLNTATYTIVTMPTAPTGLQVDYNSSYAVNSGGGAMRLSWTDNATNEDGYRVYRAENVDGNEFSLLASLAANTTSHEDLDVGDNNTLYYTVSAYNTAGDANSSVDVNITVDRSAPTQSTLTLSNNSAGSVDLNWTFTDDNATALIDVNARAYWRFDHSSGNFLQDSAFGDGNNHRGDFNSSLGNWVTGKIGNAYDFDGSTESVALTREPLMYKDIAAGTIAFWFNTDDIGSAYRPFMWYGRGDVSDFPARYMEFWVDTDSNIHGKIRATTTPNANNWEWEFEPSDWSTGEWHHFAFTVDSSGNSVYFDGVQVTPVYAGTPSSSSNFFFDDITTITASDERFLIAKNDYSGSDNFFDGKIDDFILLDKALSASDVNTLYLYGARRYDVYRSDDNVTFSLVKNGYDFNTWVDTSATDANAPNAPGTPTITVVSASEIDVNWSSVSDNSNTYYYKIDAIDYQGNDSNSSTQNTTVSSGIAKFFVNCVSGGDCASGVGSFDDYNASSATGLHVTGLAADTNYCFTVLATDGADNNSSASTQACGTTSRVAINDLNATAQTNQAVNSGDGNVLLEWSDVSGETNYTVYRSDDNSSFSTLGTIAANSTSYEDSTANDNTLYYYLVQTNHSAGDANSNTATAFTPDRTAPSTPTLTLTVNSTTNSIDANWTMPTDNNSLPTTNNLNQNPSEDSYLTYDTPVVGQADIRSYMKFDISSIPATAAITAAKLQLNINTDNDDDDYAFYHLDQNQDWVEGDSVSDIWAMSTGTFLSATNCYSATGDQNCTITSIVEASLDAGESNFSLRMEDPDNNSNSPDTKRGNKNVLYTGWVDKEHQAQASPPLKPMASGPAFFQEAEQPLNQTVGKPIFFQSGTYLEFDSSEGTTKPVLFVDYNTFSIDFNVFRSTTGESGSFTKLFSNFDGNLSHHDATVTDTNAPDTPAPPTITVVDTSTITVSWNAVSDNGSTYYYFVQALDDERSDTNSSTSNATITKGISKYFVDCVSGGDCASGVGSIDDYNSSATSLTISGLDASTNYCFTVLATDGADNNSSASEQACGTTESVVIPRGGVTTEIIRCGDGTCNGNETCTTCPQDCGECPKGVVCGNAVCEGGESYINCSTDCAVPSFTCEEQNGVICNTFEQCSGNWLTATDSAYCCLGGCSAIPDLSIETFSEPVATADNPASIVVTVKNKGGGVGEFKVIVQEAPTAPKATKAVSGGVTTSPKTAQKEESIELQQSISGVSGEIGESVVVEDIVFEQTVTELKAGDATSIQFPIEFNTIKYPKMANWQYKFVQFAVIAGPVSAEIITENNEQTVTIYFGGEELCDDKIDNDGDELVDEDCGVPEVYIKSITPIRAVYNRNRELESYTFEVEPRVRYACTQNAKLSLFEEDNPNAVAVTIIPELCPKDKLKFSFTYEPPISTVFELAGESPSSLQDPDLEVEIEDPTEGTIITMSAPDPPKPDLRFVQDPTVSPEPPIFQGQAVEIDVVIDNNGLGVTESDFNVGLFLDENTGLDCLGDDSPCITPYNYVIEGGLESDEEIELTFTIDSSELEELGTHLFEVRIDYTDDIVEEGPEGETEGETNNDYLGAFDLELADAIYYYGDIVEGEFLWASFWVGKEEVVEDYVFVIVNPPLNPTPPVEKIIVLDNYSDKNNFAIFALDLYPLLANGVIELNESYLVLIGRAGETVVVGNFRFQIHEKTSESMYERANEVSVEIKNHPRVVKIMDYERTKHLHKMWWCKWYYYTVAGVEC